jgi:protein-S-isoprenylcysteine O-methyltransferase Ste14
MDDHHLSPVPWPPLLLIAALAFGWFLREHLPRGDVGYSGIVLGAACLVGGIALVVTATMTFRRAGTNILPNRPADKLLTEGAFGLSRNPIYTGETLALIGLGIAGGMSSFLIAAVLFAVLVYGLAIRREETHLAQKFGRAWSEYAGKTRRWI